MDILDVLEEIRDLNAQQEGVTFQQLMDRHLERERKEEEEDEQIIDALAKYGDKVPHKLVCPNPFSHFLLGWE